MDFFNLSKSFDRIHLKGGQTQGFIEVDDEDFEASDFTPRFPKGKSYIKSYILEEKQQARNMCMTDTAKELSALDTTSVGTFTDKNDIGKEKLTEVFAEYYKTKPKENSRLTIGEYKTKVLSTIEQNEVTIISGPTGCGKTTQIPQYILDLHAEKNLHCNIIVTQPRRIAAISISKRVCDERSWPLGTICGYKVGLKDCTSQDTRLTYVTVGVLLQILIKAKNLNEYTHIILDEVHERDENLDFCLIVIKKLLNLNSRNVKVILMSATADVDKFACYFPKPIQGKFQPAPVIHVDRSKNFIVQIHYLEELSSLGELPEISYKNPCISELAITTCIKLIKQFEKLDQSTDQKKSVLVFLPGIYEIEELYNKLKDPKVYAPETTVYNWFTLPLHSSITVEEQALVFCSPPVGYRKIILATNIAESSITVPDVMFVIDFCLTKVLVTDPFSNFTSLQLSWASKANCIQRAGRSGRVMEGRVYRLVYKEFYKQQLRDQCVPNMLRAPLEKIVLQAKLLDMGSPKGLLALALDPPDLTNIESSILKLKEVGALLPTFKEKMCSHDGDITYLGYLMAVLPVDIHITRLIVLGHLFSCLEQCIIMGAAMSLKSVFSSPFQEKLKSYNSKLEWADGSCSDCIAFLNVYDVWKMNHLNGYFKRSAGGGETGWAKRHYIQLRGLKEVEVLVKELTQRLKTYNIENSAGVGKVSWDGVLPFVLKFVIAGAFYPNYFGRGATGGQVSEEDAVKTLGGRDPFRTVYLQNYPVEQPQQLYSHLIKEQLFECKDDMKITYDNSSKVYIEFQKKDCQTEIEDLPFNCEIPGKIATAVYRAVKMRHIMRHMEIKVLPPEQAKKMAEKLGLSPKNTFLLSGSSENPVEQKYFQSMLPGIDVSILPLKITYISDPGHFWAVNRDGFNDKFEKEIFSMLNGHNADLQEFNELPKVGEMCVAPYKEDNEVWLYRGRIEGYREFQKKTVAQIFFIDYGNTESVPVEQLLKYGPKLLERIGKIPAQAFECVLSKIKPSPIKDPNGKWSDASKKEFTELVQNGGLFGSIYSIVNGVVSLVLYKVVTHGSSVQQININEILLREGFAEEIEESYLSKANNVARKERLQDTDEANAYNFLQVKENWTGGSMLQLPDLQNCVHKMKLGGPYSPLEMKVFSFIRGGSSKYITVASSSVNSVLLDSDPQDPHERLFVAAHISQNQSGDNLLLNCTTFMPNIHGLAALIPFIFAPKVELRVNEKKTRYTGILCGLGADEDGRPIYPEHDMEIIFDCEFTFEDFSEINRLRFFMSLLLLTDGLRGEPIHSHPDVLQFQNEIKKSLMKLIDKQRPSQELEFPSKHHKWGLFEPNLVVKKPMYESYSRLSVFPLHQGISITPNPNEKQDLLNHVEMLHKIARSEIEMTEGIECELCKVYLRNIKNLKLHLTTENHRDCEKKLQPQ